MGEGLRRAFRTVFDGVRPVDIVVTAALTALGIALMIENVTASDADVVRQVRDGSMWHAQSAHSWAMLPVWCAATLPLLRWRRNLIAVTGIAVGVVVLHDVLFGWATRCGAGLPLAFVLAYLGAVALDRGRAAVVLTGSLALVVAVLAVDSSAGWGALPLGIPITAVVFAIGRAVRQRLAANAELRATTAELHRLRDVRAALELAEDRARLSERLDALLEDRLTQLAAAAETGTVLDPDRARVLFDTIETGSRATLDDMRQIVGALRGEEAGLAPAPTVAHLDALLARHRPGGASLTVTGDPRALPAVVELSAYRIVEHLVEVLAGAAGDGLAVGVRFDAESLEVRVTGPVDRAADVRTAVARARERAAFVGGSLDMKVSRGRGTAVALLPVAA